MKKLFSLFFALFALAACDTSQEFAPDENAGMQVARKVSIFESQDNQKKWILQAESVDFSDLQTATLKNPELLLKENGKDSASVTGKTGSFDYQQKKVSIEGNAKIKSFTQQLLITAERFFYDVNNNRIWSDDKTVITRGGVKVTARKGVVTDSKLTDIEIKQQTTRLPEDTRELQNTPL